MLPDLSGTRGKSFILPHMDKKKHFLLPLYMMLEEKQRQKKKKIYLQPVKVLTLQTMWCRIWFALCALSSAVRNEGNMSVMSTSN